MNTAHPLPHLFRYKFVFVSLLSPWTIANMRIFLTLGALFQTKYLYLKQSYLLLTWLYYLTFINEYGTAPKSNNTCFIAPLKRQIYTLVKAPMAHKTYSKEQFTIIYYKLHFCFQFALSHLPPCTNAALLLILLHCRSFPRFETNLLFLKQFAFFLLYNGSRALRQIT